MNNDIRKLIDDNWEDIKELIVKKTEAEQKPKTIMEFLIVVCLVLKQKKSHSKLSIKLEKIDLKNTGLELRSK